MSTSDVDAITHAGNATRLRVCMDTSDKSRAGVVYEDGVSRMTACMNQIISLSQILLLESDKIIRARFGVPPSLTPNTSTKLYTPTPTQITYSMR
jgi:hypothetical protein